MGETGKVGVRDLWKKDFITMGGFGEEVRYFDEEDIIVHAGDIIYHPGNQDCFKRYENAFHDLIKTGEFKISCGGTSMAIVRSEQDVIGGRFGEFPSEAIRYAVPERNISEDGFNLLMRRFSEHRHFVNRFDDYLKLSSMMLVHGKAAKAATAMEYLYKEIRAASEFDKFTAIGEICDGAMNDELGGKYSLVKGLVPIAGTIEDHAKRADALSNVALVLSGLGRTKYCHDLFAEALLLAL